MSIRLRLTLLYSVILALTLLAFGAALYTIQARDTLNALKRDLEASSDGVARLALRSVQQPAPSEPPPERQPPMPLEQLSGEQAFRDLREREIVRVLDANGMLLTSPLGSEQDALPLSAAGLQALQDQRAVWWETVWANGEHLLIANRPVVVDGRLLFIVQAARPLTERDRSLTTLARTLVAAGVLTILVAFAIGWGLAGITLRPIHRITQTAQAIGRESDLARRVDYAGPDDEIGQLATTFNAMLSRLQEVYRQLSQALNLQRQFVADVSHELRTPLTTVRGNLALLHRAPALPAEEQADILTDLVAESDRLIRLVNSLLMLARADAGPSMKREEIQLRPVIEETCRQARQLDREREIIEDAQDATVVGDRDALKQVFLILLDNALKHSRGAITVAAEAIDRRVIVRVQDHGPGMSPSALEHAFERFHRGDAGPNVPGFGLGLPIAKALVESQGGAISIVSELGVGSTVQMELPRVSPS
ncbi:MAG: HAMP domain-containing histidine kinase [Anaerolineales bacterium]|nr:HAMP domain-containing histidine kinase [Anaerolineales bacterium]